MLQNESLNCSSQGYWHSNLLHLSTSNETITTFVILFQPKSWEGKMGQDFLCFGHWFHTSYFIVFRFTIKTLIHLKVYMCIYLSQNLSKSWVYFSNFIYWIIHSFPLKGSILSTYTKLFYMLGFFNTVFISIFLPTYKDKNNTNVTTIGC